MKFYQSEHTEKMKSRFGLARDGFINSSNSSTNFTTRTGFREAFISGDHGEKGGGMRHTLADLHCSRCSIRLEPVERQMSRFRTHQDDVYGHVPYRWPYAVSRLGPL